jgi:hypothetical protein
MVAVLPSQCRWLDPVWLLLRHGAGRPCCGARGHQDTAAFFGYFHPNLQDGAKGIEGLLRQLIGVKVVNGLSKNFSNSRQASSNSRNEFTSCRVRHGEADHQTH